LQELLGLVASDREAWHTSLEAGKQELKEAIAADKRELSEAVAADMEGIEEVLLTDKKQLWEAVQENRWVAVIMIFALGKAWGQFR
jgi:hypothetical protein